MTANTLLYAAEIDRYRNEAVADATRAAREARFPADVVEAAGFRAGDLWDLANPMYAASRVRGRP